MKRDKGYSHLETYLSTYSTYLPIYMILYLYYRQLGELTIEILFDVGYKAYELFRED